MKRPNMRYEILEALEEFYKNDEEDERPSGKAHRYC